MKDEIAEIDTSIHRSLGNIGIPDSIKALTEGQATYENVCDRLSSGNVHLLHFAGHGRVDDQSPESSGVEIDVGQSAQILSTGALKALLSGSGVEIAMLCCCVCARTRSFAVTFYDEELMTTLSPGVAVLRARNASAADRQRGRDNVMWASRCWSHLSSREVKDFFGI